jgi:hypothetical protein
VQGLAQAVAGGFGVLGDIGDAGGVKFQLIRGDGEDFDAVGRFIGEAAANAARYRAAD